MLTYESYGNTTAMSDSRELDSGPEREPVASTSESATHYLCKRCQAALTTEPEFEGYDWFLRCLLCGAKNLLALSFQIIGWRR